MRRVSRERFAPRSQRVLHHRRGRPVDRVRDVGRARCALAHAGADPIPVGNRARSRRPHGGVLEPRRGAQQHPSRVVSGGRSEVGNDDAAVGGGPRRWRGRLPRGPRRADVDARGDPPARDDRQGVRRSRGPPAAGRSGAGRHRSPAAQRPAAGRERLPAARRRASGWARRAWSGGARRMRQACSSRSSRSRRPTRRCCCWAKPAPARSCSPSQIHERGPRQGRAMVRVNCAAIPGDAHRERAVRPRKGRVHGRAGPADRPLRAGRPSTIFLDEIGDLPLDVQVKLLRVLEERKIERLGSPRPIAVDTRIIAATHRDLEQLIAEGTFREDLYYRLNVFPIQVPPLRERVRGHSAAGLAVRRRVLAGVRQADRIDRQGEHGGAAALPVARQHPRAAQRRRARDDRRHRHRG